MCGKEVLRKIRWVWGLAYLLCTCLFFYQLVGILPNYFAPTMTNTEVKDVPLEDMNFPLDFKICFRPFELNNTALRQLGYIHSYAYVLGMSKFNGSLIGWGGHNNQSVPEKDASDVLDAVKFDWTKAPLFSMFYRTFP